MRLAKGVSAAAEGTGHMELPIIHETDDRIGPSAAEAFSASAKLAPEAARELILPQSVSPLGCGIWNGCGTHPAG